MRKGVMTRGVLSATRGLLSSVEGVAVHTSALAPNSAPAQAPAVDLITVTVDGRQVQVPKTATALQACEAAGVDVPR